MYYANLNMIGYLPTADGYECATLDEAKETLISLIRDTFDELLENESNNKEKLTAVFEQLCAELRTYAELPIAVIYEGYCYFISETE